MYIKIPVSYFLTLIHNLGRPHRHLVGCSLFYLLSNTPISWDYQKLFAVFLQPESDNQSDLWYCSTLFCVAVQLPWNNRIKVPSKCYNVCKNNNDNVVKNAYSISLIFEKLPTLSKKHLTSSDLKLKRNSYLNVEV